MCTAQLVIACKEHQVETFQYTNGKYHIWQAEGGCGALSQEEGILTMSISARMIRRMKRRKRM